MIFHVAGSYVLKPRGLMHTFWNAGPARHCDPGDPGLRRELAAKYGVTYPSDWVAELAFLKKVAK